VLYEEFETGPATGVCTVSNDVLRAARPCGRRCGGLERESKSPRLKSETWAPCARSTLSKSIFQTTFSNPHFCRQVTLELDVGAEARDDHRAAVAVVTGVGDVLEAGGEVDAAPGVDGVVSFENIFAAVGEVAVAEEESEAAGGEIVLVVFRDAVADEGHTGAILFAMPP